IGLLKNGNVKLTFNRQPQFIFKLHLSHILTKKVLLFMQNFTYHSKFRIFKTLNIFGLILLLFLISPKDLRALEKEKWMDIAVEVTGVVTDQNGESLPGVSILEMGTNNGTVSDIDGRF